MRPSCAAIASWSDRPRETACIERASGRVIWRVPTPRAASGRDPARAGAAPPGRHDRAARSRERRSPLHDHVVPPRAGGGACGAVVHVPGLPKLLVVVEGDRRVTAIDLVSGDVRWRFTARRPANFRLRRAGKLLLVAGGDSALVALDVSTRRRRLARARSLAVHRRSLRRPRRGVRHLRRPDRPGQAAPRRPLVRRAALDPRARRAAGARPAAGRGRLDRRRDRARPARRRALRPSIARPANRAGSKRPGSPRRPRPGSASTTR